MLQHEKTILRSFDDNDNAELARLAKNKKIWHNLRDLIPFPCTIDDAIFFINLTKKENPQMIFAVEFEGQFCVVISLVGQQDVYRKNSRNWLLDRRTFLE